MTFTYGERMNHGETSGLDFGCKSGGQVLSARASNSTCAIYIKSSKKGRVRASRPLIEALRETVRNVVRIR